MPNHQRRQDVGCCLTGFEDQSLMREFAAEDFAGMNQGSMGLPAKAASTSAFISHSAMPGTSFHAASSDFPPNPDGPFKQGHGPVLHPHSADVVAMSDRLKVRQHRRCSSDTLALWTQNRGGRDGLPELGRLESLKESVKEEAVDVKAVDAYLTFEGDEPLSPEEGTGEPLGSSPLDYEPDFGSRGEGEQTPLENFLSGSPFANAGLAGASKTLGLSMDDVDLRDGGNKRSKELALLDSKKAKRILANRLSAQRSRIRKLVFTADLERRVCQLNQEVADLSPKIQYMRCIHADLSAENLQLKSKIERLVEDSRERFSMTKLLQAQVNMLKTAQVGAPAGKAQAGGAHHALGVGEGEEAGSSRFQ